MKIHFIISSIGHGGAERVLVLMANNLAKNSDNEISVITLFNKKDNYRLNPSIKRERLKESPYIPSHTLRSIINLSRYYRSVANRPDIIISFITLTNLICIIVAKLFKIKIIAQEHNSYLRYMNGRKIITKLTKKYVYKMADLVTVLTSFDLPYYTKFGVNVRVMPNPCTFIPIKYNSHRREKTILAVGHLDRYHHKGFDNLVKLIAPILISNPEWKLKIAGYGSKGLEYLSKLVNQYNLENQVLFLGFVDNVSELMQRSSIFILSSRFEGLPMVLLEAMSQGMACISYNCKTGPSDIIEHGVNGILIDDQDSLKMQEKLNELINNENLRIQLSYEAIQSLDKFHISNITKKYQDLFNKLLLE